MPRHRCSSRSSRAPSPDANAGADSSASTREATWRTDETRSFSSVRVSNSLPSSSGALNSRRRSSASGWECAHSDRGTCSRMAVVIVTKRRRKCEAA